MVCGVWSHAASAASGLEPCVLYQEPREEEDDDAEVVGEDGAKRVDGLHQKTRLLIGLQRTRVGASLRLVA